MERAVTRLAVGGGLLLTALGALSFWAAYAPTADGLPAMLLAYLSAAPWPPALGLLASAAGLGVAAALVDRDPAGDWPGGLRQPVASPEAGRTINRALLELAARLAQRLDAGAEPDIVGYLDDLLAGATRIGASDVHLHPLADATHIGFRIHGVLEDVTILPSALHARLLMRLKVVFNLVTYKSDAPQDGQASLTLADRPTTVRISILPTSHGEKAVLRVAVSGAELPELARIGMLDAQLRRFVELLRRPQGVVYLTGPTGSGKTTTIYSSLAHLKSSRGGGVTIASIEDPIERDVPFISQTQVNAAANLGFAQGLRSILRQDPNVLMVGEVRDVETAQIAIQAGLTGHLLLTTVHADSAAGVFNRLIDMGVEPFLVASASLASLSQRLVLALCPHCRRPTRPTPEERAWLARVAHPYAGEPFFRSVGCRHCRGQGHVGSTAVYELLPVSPGIREAVSAKVDTQHIHAVALAEGLLPLSEAAYQQALAGVTTLAEAQRISG